MFDQGATAVLATRELPFMVAVKKAGIYSFEEGEWLLQYRMSENIYKLVNLGAYIFGIGDFGTIIRYNLQDNKWTHTSFPTPQRLWDITGNSQGLIVTHGGSNLYVSNNYGSNWYFIKPFQSLPVQPVIRSLLYDHDSIYIGTQINREYGGLWKYCLSTRELKLVKKETQTMVSSIYKDEDGFLFITKGEARSGKGSIEMLNPYRNRWIPFEQPISEKAFLDVFQADNKLYATTSHDEYGFSRIYEVNKDSLCLHPIETVAGHGFRGAGFKNQLFICSPVESKWIINNCGESKLVH